VTGRTKSDLRRFPDGRLILVTTTMLEDEADYAVWCPTCQLPSACRASFAVEADSRPHSVFAMTVCHDCGYDDHEWNPE
jgi:hypothetical protein